MDDKLKAGLKEFFIDTYLEFNRDQVINTLRTVLAPISAKDLKLFVSKNEVPPLLGLVVQHLKGYEDYLEKVKPEEVYDWLDKARPDLTELLVSLGDQGAEYIVKLKWFIIDSIKGAAPPEKEGGEGEEQTESPSSPDHVRLHCDECGESWIATREGAEATAECPFCGAPR